MPVPYQSTLAQTVDALAGFIADRLEVQDWLGVASAAAARARIVEADADAPPAGNHILLGSPRRRFTRTPGGAYTGTAEIEVVLVAEPVDGDSIAEALRRAWNVHGALLTALTDFAFGQVEELREDPPTRLADGDGLDEWVESTITVVVRCRP